jgi:hypothetical protein
MTTLAQASLTLQTARSLPPRFAPGLSTTHGGIATGDPGVSPDRTHTGRPPRTCRSYVMRFSFSSWRRSSPGALVHCDSAVKTASAVPHESPGAGRLHVVHGADNPDDVVKAITAATAVELREISDWTHEAFLLVGAGIAYSRPRTSSKFGSSKSRSTEPSSCRSMNSPGSLGGRRTTACRTSCAGCAYGRSSPTPQRRRPGRCRGDAGWRVLGAADGDAQDPPGHRPDPRTSTPAQRRTADHQPDRHLSTSPRWACHSLRLNQRAALTASRAGVAVRP